MKTKLFFLMIILLNSFHFAHAQTDTLAELQDTIKLGNISDRSSGTNIPVVSISLPLAQQLSFQLSLDKTSWVTYSINGIDTKLIDTGVSDFCYFMMETQNKVAKYILYKGKSYRIFWNETALKWDLPENVRP